MANEQEVIPQVSNDSVNQVVTNVTNTLTAVQSDLNSLKQLIHDADIINSNREQLIEKLEKINTHLKTINVGNIAYNTTSKTSADIKDEDIISGFIKETGVRRTTVADIKVHSNKIAESMTYLKNVSKEILNITKHIENFNNKTVAFEGSDEERNEQIKNLECERHELKEELFNFILETMDHSYEYQELAATLEEENNAMENEIIQLLTIINELRDVNRFLLHENKKLNRKISMWKYDSDFKSYSQDKISTLTCNTEQEIDYFDRPTIYSCSPSSKILSMDSIRLDAKMESWSTSEDTLQKILCKLHEDHYVMTNTHNKLEKIKHGFNPRERPLLNLHTNIDPRIHTFHR